MTAEAAKELVKMKEFKYQIRNTLYIQPYNVHHEETFLKSDNEAPLDLDVEEDFDLQVPDDFPFEPSVGSVSTPVGQCCDVRTCNILLCFVVCSSGNLPGRTEEALEGSCRRVGRCLWAPQH